MSSTLKKLLLVIGILGIIFLIGYQYFKISVPEKRFTIMWSIYVGWMPWPYAAESGILAKWAEKYGIEIEFKQADYIPSIEAYVAGEADGVVMTNMEALNIAGTAGIDTTAIIIGDFSNGNDAVITRNQLGICDLKDHEVYLVKFSVSHYLLARGLEQECQGRVTESDILLFNTSDSDIGPVFVAIPSRQAVVTWNPILLEILSQVPGADRVYDSSKIPFEILDILFVNTEILNKHPELAMALAGTWYETLALMRSETTSGIAALEAMARRSGTNVDLYKQQLETTHMWWDPTDAVEFTRSQQLIKSMDQVAQFSFSHGLYGPEAKSAENIGILFPNGKIIGNTDNIKLRFTDIYMQMAANAQL